MIWLQGESFMSHLGIGYDSNPKPITFFLSCFLTCLRLHVLNLYIFWFKKSSMFHRNSSELMFDHSYWINLNYIFVPNSCYAHF